MYHGKRLLYSLEIDANYPLYAKGKVIEWDVKMWPSQGLEQRLQKACNATQVPMVAVNSRSQFSHISRHTSHKKEHGGLASTTALRLLINASHDI